MSLACWLCAAAGGTAQPATSSAPEPGRGARLVVAPFVNLSQQSDDAWIGIGIAETVAADLLQSGAVSGVSVLAVTATAVGEQPTDDTALRAAAQQDGAVWLVHGGYQHVGTGLRITGRIVDVRTGGTVYTVQADGLLDELFDVQDELAAAFDTWL
ncbi:MAG: hypothetical protein OSB03_13895, partial [Vicinamibacterales bacterium]|nr:hypothetical protein [Vicinamibacterales bacterium]